MKIVALISGGKDSIFNALCCVEEGHELVALANLHPKDKDELDSFMYQTVGHMGIEKIAEAMELPLYRRITRGQSLHKEQYYKPTVDDEVEDLYELLLEVIQKEEGIEGVASGAISSDYQRIRVENVCERLNLVSLAYLWRRDQSELLQEMIDCKIEAILIKVAALGLLPNHLGKSIKEMKPHLKKLHDQYGINVCGEGGEYESFVLDCPLFKQRIVAEDVQLVISSSDPVCPVGYINFTKLKLVQKSKCEKVRVKTSKELVSNLCDSSDEIFHGDLNIVELDHNFATIVSCETSQNESDPIYPINKPNAVQSSKGWLSIGGIQSSMETTEDAVEEAMISLQEQLNTKEYKLNDLVHVTLYIRNMSDYLIINRIYSKWINFQNPPCRVCVESSLPPNCHVIMEALAFKSTKDANLDRHALHVQSISHWCPANIGQYSQSIQIGNVTYISGQIALCPGTMQLIDGDIKSQIMLILRNISRIAEAMHVARRLRNVVQGICFLTSREYIAQTRKLWENETTNAIMEYIIVPNLPRNSLIEIQVWLHSHNDKFEYEETGYAIENYTISIKRRWDYENDCAAAICTVSTGSSNTSTPSTPATPTVEPNQINAEWAKQISGEQLMFVFDYVVQKMLHSSGDEATVKTSKTLPAINLRIFYREIFAPSVQLLHQVAIDYANSCRDQVHLAFTIISAIGLQKNNDFISICAIRHE